MRDRSNGRCGRLLTGRCRAGDKKKQTLDSRLVEAVIAFNPQGEAPSGLGVQEVAR